MIDVYYSSHREAGFSKEEVSFYLGFSWPRPIALDVKNTRTDRVKYSLELKDTSLHESSRVRLATSVDVDKYIEYTSRARKLEKTLEEIEVLKEKKKKGQTLEDNEVISHYFTSSCAFDYHAKIRRL